MKKTLDIFAIVILCLIVYVVSVVLAVYAISDYKTATKLGWSILALLVIAWSAIRGGKISYEQQENEIKRKQPKRRMEKT